MSDENDLQTPPQAVEIIIPYLKKFSVAWECASGEEYISSVLRKNGIRVIETDIKTGYDFLSVENMPNSSIELIITNPPYNLKDKFLEKCFYFWKKYRTAFALLMPTTALGGIKRVGLYIENGLEILVPDRRVNFIYDGAKDRSWFHTSWFCKGVLPEKLMFTRMEKK